MNFEERYNNIKLLISQDKLAQAIESLELILSEDKNQEEAYYLKGNVFRKQQHWKQAIDNYTMAIELNSDSPAQEARRMCIEILNFYNTDMYNH